MIGQNYLLSFKISNFIKAIRFITYKSCIYLKCNQICYAKHNAFKNILKTVIKFFKVEGLSGIQSEDGSFF